jgi:uncharacterized protein (DUF1499 family)
MRRHLPPEPVSRAAIWSRRLGLLAAVGGVLTVVLARLHKMDGSTALSCFGVVIALALGAVFSFSVACVSIWRWGGRGVGAAINGFLLAALALAWPSYLAVEALRLPVLSDIATDVDDPPDFARSREALKARGGYSPPNPTAAGRSEQEPAYPDVKPIMLDADLDEAIALVLKAGAAKGWRVVEQRPPSARSGDAHIDFLARSMILGLDEDVTVRLRPLAGQTRVDVRAASRHGRHDFGFNARRIKQLEEELQAEEEQR